MAFTVCVYFKLCLYRPILIMIINFIGLFLFKQTKKEKRH